MPLAGNLDKGIDEGHSVRATPVRFRTGSTVRKRNARSLGLLVMKGLADTAYESIHRINDASPENSHPTKA